MTTRTIKTTVTFHEPFRLAGSDEELPAGDYVMKTDEEVIEGLTWLAYRRVATFLNIPSVSTQSLFRRVVRVQPSDIDAILAKSRHPDV